MADPTRRTIFERLADGPRAVVDLADALPVSRPAVSQHLRVLKEAGLVVDERAGNRRLYQVSPDGIGALRSYLDRFWNRTLVAFKAAAEREENNMTLTDTDVRKAVTVNAPIDKAFRVFTDGIASWWPADHHILQADLADMVFESHVGGNIYDRGVDGSECRWARVLDYEPPNRVVFSWDIGLDWQLADDPAKTSEVEVSFHPEAPDRTRVELQHRELARHGDGWEAMREAVASEGGWQRGLDAFAAAVN